MPEENTLSELARKLSRLEKEQERYKLAEAALRFERDRVQNYLDIVQVMVVALNSVGKITLINQRGCQMLGWSESELIGKDWFYNCLPQPEGMQQVYPFFKKLMAGETDTIEPIENPILTRQGKLRYIAWQTTPLHDETGQLIGTLNAGEDITERRRIERALRDSEERYRLLFQNLTAGFAFHEIIVDELGKPCDYRFLDMNSAFEKITGWRAEDILGQRIRSLMPDIEPLWLETYGKVALSRKPIRFESYVKHLNRHFAVTAYSPKPLHFATIFEDITKRKTAETALHESREELAEIFSMSLDLICIADINDFVFLKVNPAFTRILGYTEQELLKQSFLTLIHPDDVQPTKQMICEKLRKGKTVLNHINRFRRKNDGYRWIEWVSHPIASRSVTFAVGHDITERIMAEEEKKKLEDQLRQVHRLEAMGTLAGGIAHDFNNLLTSIQGRISLLALDLEPGDPQLGHIAAIEDSIRGATNLTRQLLGAARGGKYEVTPVDMNRVIQSSLEMFGRANKALHFHKKIHESPLIVEADRRQIEQVLLNIYINAAQAMPTGGKLFIETDWVTMAASVCEIHQVAPGPYVKVAISDTGVGMTAEVRRRVFDPFFTTKEKRRGTGLGLASAYGIIKNHGGMITVHSEPGHGATFTVYLPVSDKSTQEEVSTKKKICKGSESILLVDDETIIIEVAKNMLQRMGYRVLAANGGQQAVGIVSKLGDSIDLVILDLIMPGMDGIETFDRIRKLYPHLPVLLSSGYAVSGQAEALMRKGCNGFIQKPYSIIDLSQKVRKILNEANG